MKVLRHGKSLKNEYGRVCPFCRSMFTFTLDDAEPGSIYANPYSETKECTVICPDCGKKLFCLVPLNVEE